MVTVLAVVEVQVDLELYQLLLVEMVKVDLESS
jgi:hypothetical protein